MNESLPVESTEVRRRRYSGIELLIAIVALFVFYPFIENLRSAGLIESILLTIVLISAIVTISAEKSVLVIAIILAVPTLVGRWINYGHPHSLSAEIYLISAIVFVVFIIANLMRYILTAPEITVEVICESLCVYLLLALAWTFAYWLVAEIVPDAFAFNASIKGTMTIKGFDGLYFSIVTLSTLGYGDISPVAKAARMLAGMEALCGPLYMAVLIARLVATRAVPKPT
jgi:voltage-gated potassium channel Kch